MSVSILLSLHLVAAPLSVDEMQQLLVRADDRLATPGDYQALVYMEERRPDSEPRIFQLTVFRRGKEGYLVLLFKKPKTSAGQGYLRRDKNMWFYSPATGKWERRTESERIAGTDARRRDFDDWRLHEEYTPVYEGEAKLGNYDVHKLKLTAKPNIDVAFPIQVLWIDKATSNPLKLESRALSGQLVSTSYYPAWTKAVDKATKREVYYPEEIRIVNEIDKGAQTIIKVQQTNLETVPENTFSKAWLESQSR